MREPPALTTPPAPGRELASEGLLEEERPDRTGPRLWPSAVGGLIAVVLFTLGYTRVALVMGGLLCGRVLIITLAPAAIRSFEVVLARVLGGIVAYLVLTPVWLLFVVPFGVLSGRRRRMTNGTPSWVEGEKSALDHSSWS